MKRELELQIGTSFEPDTRGAYDQEPPETLFIRRDLARLQHSGELGSLPRLRLGPRALADYELLACGAFAPLPGFMGRDDYESCLRTLRLDQGALFPIPITLPTETPFEPGTRVALVHPRGDILAILDTEEVFEVDPQAEALALLGDIDPPHPYLAELKAGPRLRLAGRLTHVRPVPHGDFRDLRLGPAEVRQRLRGMGRPKVVAFQTRNPIHRSHEELIKRAARAHDAAVLLHPVVGGSVPSDVDSVTRVRTYRALVGKYFDPDTTLLALLPYAMRMVGPREALLHAIVRRTYGATHFIIGRDHAGIVRPSGESYFAPYAAQELVAEYADEIGIEVVRFREMVYLRGEQRYEEQDRVPAGVAVSSLSGTEVRRLLGAGLPLPEWFTRPEIGRILQEAHPPRRRRGFCVWLTGLSGAGKSSTAQALSALLQERGRTVTVLDGDEVRETLSRGLGFTREDREQNVLRIAFVAAEVVRHRGIAVCAAVSPFRDARNRCRSLIGDGFVEVFLDTNLVTCQARDAKGLYARDRKEGVPGLTGVHQEYEEPLSPEVRLSDSSMSAEGRAKVVVEFLQTQGFLDRPAGEGGGEVQASRARLAAPVPKR